MRESAKAEGFKNLCRLVAGNRETMIGMGDGDHQPGPTSDEMFAMDPQQALLELARHLIEGQNVLAELSGTARAAQSLAPRNQQAQALLTEVDHIRQQWHTKALPSLAAAMKVALEVYDTFGSGTTTIEDPTEAALWNNKFVVWERELGGCTPERSLP